MTGRLCWLLSDSEDRSRMSYRGEDFHPNCVGAHLHSDTLDAYLEKTPGI